MDACTQEEPLFVSRRISKSRKFKLPPPNENKFPFNSSDIVSGLGVYTLWPTFETTAIFKSFFTERLVGYREQKKNRETKNTLINTYTKTQGDSPSTLSPFFLQSDFRDF